MAERGILNPRFALNAVREYCLAVARTYRVAVNWLVLLLVGSLQHDEGEISRISSRSCNLITAKPCISSATCCGISSMRSIVYHQAAEIHAPRDDIRLRR